MIQKWAASLLFIENRGWVRQVVITFDIKDNVFTITPFKQEPPFTKWLHSGVLLLCSKESKIIKVGDSLFIDEELNLSQIQKEIFSADYSELYFCTPFNIVDKEPVCETQRKLLH
ncbi:MAG: hypothetical protein PHQ88_03800 [Bacteroides sp.]|nr:hypothetical protein [Bacteroides sp.]MDD2645364.1 hypothetical protein [Bacteroides sp.]MDD4055690.1 hypothetical protein [Bacteroides sp.]MDD4719970.1 hypothetical protein [Bacteroides sp.]NLI63248.1 hypothetical protein [Bacteroidales bacterium]